MTRTTDADRLAADLAGKRAIVTGAGSGIGKAIAAAFVRHGVRVAMADINLKAAEAAAAELGGGAIGMKDARRLRG